jgi:hypothetical protein
MSVKGCIYLNCSQSPFQEILERSKARSKAGKSREAIVNYFLIIMNYRLFSLFLFVMAIVLNSCADNNFRVHLKNASFFHRSVFMNIAIDGKVLVSDTINYDNSEYGSFNFNTRIANGNHELRIKIPQLSIYETKQIVVNDSSKNCFITLVDNTSNPSYKNGDVKLNVSFLNKLPL